ncbi:MAG: efflux RND transporter periplasmic adaptor subunit [Kiritimatiellae bacterium]|nr:efflux RND transporter periplasmic adaptor subunit [Kiritimatiellia bacterium]
MKLKRTKIFVGVIALGLLLVAFLIGRWTVPAAMSSATPEMDGKGHTQNAEPEVWTCSMHPQIKLPKKGKCPICFMDLIMLEKDSDNDGERELSVSQYSAKLMELESSPVIRKFAQAEIRMVGMVDYDETRVSYISAWIPGRLDRLFVDYTGIPVRKGDHMVKIYSPDLLTAQEELLQSIKVSSTLMESESEIMRRTALTTVTAAREKLRLWGFTAEQIAAIEKSGTPAEHMTIYSPGAGIVIHKNVQEGMYVETGTKIYTIADLSKVWIQLDAYESDLNWLRYGGAVEFTTATDPGKTFEGTISFIDPIINSSTRTAKVRVIVDNPTLELKPGMFVRAIARPMVAQDGSVMNSELAGKWISPMHPEVIKDGPGSCDVCGMPLVTAESLGYVADNQQNAPLLIPVSAAMKTGKRAVVYVEVPESDKPTYEGREIEVGLRLGDYYVVQDGLAEGERVVTRGAFKLDAELQIRAKPGMMSPQEEAHSGHDAALIADKTLTPLATPMEFSMQLGAVVDAYFEIHKQLAGDAPAGAKDAAVTMKEKLEQVNMGLLDHDAHMVWMEHLKNLNRVVGKLAKEDKIVRQRELFYQLSQQLINSVKLFRLQQPVYQAFCPMAFNDTGATWLQSTKELLNPYFGKTMLRCGEIQATIEAAAGKQEHDHE